MRAISIHVPLAGHDDGGNYLVSDPALISIHMPLAGHDGIDKLASALADDFNPHAPCGARPPFVARRRMVVSIAISIHVPLAGHDRRRPQLTGNSYDFNPRAPCGARLTPRHTQCAGGIISIHVPLAGHDIRTARTAVTGAQFQSTCPLRGTTLN